MARKANECVNALCIKMCLSENNFMMKITSDKYYLKLRFRFSKKMSFTQKMALTYGSYLLYILRSYHMNKVCNDIAINNALVLPIVSINFYIFTT